MTSLFSIRLSMLHAIVAAVDIDAAIILFAQQRQVLGTTTALRREGLEVIPLGPVPGPPGVRAAWHDRTVIIGHKVSS
jgi:hypothetical protein